MRCNHIVFLFFLFSHPPLSTLSLCNIATPLSPPLSAFSAPIPLTLSPTLPPPPPQSAPSPPFQLPSTFNINNTSSPVLISIGMHKSSVQPNRRAKATVQHKNGSAKSLSTSKKPRKTSSTLNGRRLRLTAKRFATKSKPAASPPSPSPPPTKNGPGPGVGQPLDPHLHNQLTTMMTQFEAFQQGQLAFQQQFQQQLQQLQQQCTILTSQLDDTISPTDAKEWHAAQNFQPLFNWSKKAATDYDPEGAYYLGLLFSEGRIAVSDVLTAQTQTTKTPPLTLKKGKPGLPDHHRAFRLWTIAADRGHVDAQHRLGWLHFNGDLSSCQQVELVEGQPWSGPPGSKWSQSYQTLQWGPDVPTAIKLWTDLAQKGHLDSQLTLGKLYSNASAGSLDYQAAVKWYEEAAALGHLDSQCTLGDLYSTNKLGAPDFAAAAKWYTGAAELGHAKSQINLGKLHRDGHLGPPDYQAALKWFTKATEQGDAEGQFQTGLLHQHHLNSPDLDPNFDEACAWYRKAAEQGHVESQATLGIGYEEGTFISTDPDEPRHWLTKAAEQGHARAQFHLGQLYFAQDTAASDRTAAKWFLKAGRQGVPSARLFLTAAVNSRGARRQNNEDVGPDISDSEA